MKKTKVVIFIIMFFVSICSVIYAVSSYYGEYTVYVTDSGSKYHSLGCDAMKSAPKRTTVATAEKYGYSPCKVCNPYGLATEFYRLDNNKDENLYIILGLIVLTVLYMAIPFWFKIKKAKWYSHKDLIQFVVLNDILASLICFILAYGGKSITFGNIVGHIFTASTFGLINYFLLYKNVIEE